MVLDPEKDQESAQCWTSLSRCPRCIAHLLAKRSGEQGAKKLWAGALIDANRVIFYRILAEMISNNERLGNRNGPVVFFGIPE